MKRLSFNILLNLILVLGTGMFLVDAVIMAAAHRMAVESETAGVALLITAVAGAVDRAGLTEDAGTDTRLLFEASGFSGLMIADGSPDGFLDLSRQNSKALPREEMQRLARLALTEESRQTCFTGTAWGIFRSRSQYMLVSAPLRHKGRITGGLCIVTAMGPVYSRLQDTQKMAGAYGLVNLIILSIIGLYQISRLTIRPLHRMLNRVESCREDEAFFFRGEKDNSDFNRLSRALNRMLARISSDREELRHMVRSLETANAELRQARNDVINAEKLATVGRLAAGIAHEIGNPVAIVMGYLDLIRQADISPEEKQDFICRTESEIQRIHKIIRQLLDFSRPAKGEIQTVPVCELVHDILGGIQVLPFMNGIRLNIRCGAQNDHISADPAQLRQIFLNLAMNAADAIAAGPDPSAGEITIATETVPAHEAGLPGNLPALRIIVSDNGEGIPEDHLNSIFDPFFTTKSPGKGTGLGLSVCFTMIESLGGKIRAESASGSGTSIIIHLPLASGERQDHEH